MNIDPSSQPVVKEFRFYPESEIVTVVFGDDNAEDFTGPENYQLAVDASRSVSAPTFELDLKDEKGNSITMTVARGTPHETFDA
jgi:hypothetical protein